MFEPEAFRKQMYCIEESTCEIVGTFWRPRSHSAPGELRPPCPPRYAPDSAVPVGKKMNMALTQC